MRNQSHLLDKWIGLTNIVEHRFSLQTTRLATLIVSDWSYVANQIPVCVLTTPSTVQFRCQSLNVGLLRALLTAHDTLLCGNLAAKPPEQGGGD